MFTRNMLQSNSFLILIISISILGTISSFLTGFLNFSFDLDLYQIISASNEISKKELGSINFFPNSSLGIDILFWPYIFPPFVYSLFTNLFTNLYQFYFLITLEYLVSIFLLFFISIKLLKIFKWSNNKKIIFIFFSLVFLSPLFNQYFIGGKSTYRWCFIFTLISINFLINILYKKKNNNTNNFACGFFSSLTPLSFVSMGLPVFVGIQFNFLINNFIINKLSIKKKIINFLYFLAGTVTPLIFSFIYIKNYGNSQDIQNLFKLIFAYGNEVSPFSLYNFIIKYGYFISSLFVTSYVKVSFLPIFILTLIIHLIYFKNFPENLKIFIRLLSIFVISWLIIAIPFSSHAYAPRMSILNPLFICLFINLFFINLKDKLVLNFFIYFSIFIFILQIITVVLLKNYNLYILSVPAGIIITVLIIFIFYKNFFKVKKIIFKEKKYLNFFLYAISIFLLFKVFYLKSSSIFSVLNLTYGNYVNSKTIFPNHENYFENARNKINKYLNNDDYVLTNKPYKDLFPNNKLIALFGYRTFYGGVNKEAADKVFIFNDQDYYEGIGKNSIIYFKGFYYKIVEKVDLHLNNYFFYGENINYSGENYIKSKDFYINKEKIDKYFEWREKKFIKNK